ADLQWCIRANMTAWRQEFRAPRSWHQEVGPVRAVAFSSDGKHLALGKKDGTIQLQNRRTGRIVQTFHLHIRSVNALAFSPDDRFLLSGSDDQDARLWDTTTGNHVGKLLRRQAGIVTRVGFVTDRKGIWTAESSAAVPPKPSGIGMWVSPDMV